MFSWIIDIFYRTVFAISAVVFNGRTVPPLDFAYLPTFLPITPAVLNFGQFLSKVRSVLAPCRFLLSYNLPR